MNEKKPAILNEPIKRAMILAAGSGSRMPEWTSKHPKCLALVNDAPLLVHHLLELKAAGITDVVINICFFADQIVDAIGDGRRWGINVHYSDERDASLDKPLGVVDGVKRALPVLGDQPFLLRSADVWGDIPWQELMASAAEMPDKTMATLLGVDLALGGHHDFDLSLEQKCVMLTGAKPADCSNWDWTPITFAGAAVLHPRCVAESSAGSLTDCLREYLLQQRVRGCLQRGDWYNINTFAELQRVNDLFK